ncbi:hypothetical protein CM15mP37_00490 [bacterium]|nr:MAG: hypothetical protein CM15mP37_00490 [bacterium]
MEKSELRENVVIKDPKISSHAFIAKVHGLLVML